jgi:hypothetical protein
MRERSQVSGSADRSLARNHRRQFEVDQLLQHLDAFGPHARDALRQAGKFQPHHQPHDIRWRGFAHSRRVREDDISLQHAQFGVADADRGEFAEAGIDAVHRLTARDDSAHRIRTRLYARQASGIEPHLRARKQLPPLGQDHVPGMNRDDRVLTHMSTYIANNPHSHAFRAALPDWPSTGIGLTRSDESDISCCSYGQSAARIIARADCPKGNAPVAVSSSEHNSLHM